MVSTSSNVLEPYNGSDPYVFVSYSHKDKNQVLPIIEFIQKKGFKVWYDKGLITGANWRETIAERIEHCAMFLICLSPNCEFNKAGTPSMIRNELYLANDVYHKDKIFPIMLEDFTLPGGIIMTLVPYHILLKYEMTDDEFFERLETEITAIIPAPKQGIKTMIKTKDGSNISIVPNNDNDLDSFADSFGHLVNKPKEILELFENLRKKIQEIDSRIEEYSVKTYIGYKILNHKFVEAYVLKNKIFAYLDAPITEINPIDNRGLAKEVPESYKYGNISSIEITPGSDISYCMMLIQGTFQFIKDKYKIL